MRKLGTGAVLMMTTILIAAGSVPSAAQMITGTLEDASKYFDTAGSDSSAGTGFVYRVKISDPANAGISFPQKMDFNDVFRFFRTGSDMTQPIPSGEEVELFLTAFAFGSAASSFTFSSFASFVSGEEISVVLSCSSGCDPEDEFAFEFFGTEIPVPPDLGPGVAEELAALIAAAGGSARLIVLDAQGVARDLGQASIVARGDRLTLELVEATDGDDVVVSSKSETPGLVGNLYTWAQITGFDSEEDNGPGSINGTGFQIGADMAVGTDMVAGLSLGYSDINSSDVGFSQDGTMTYLQPYFSYRSGAWQGNASLIFGQGDYDQTSEGGAGTGETDLFAFTFEGGYDMPMQNDLTVTPMFGLIAGNEDVTGISGTLANAGTESYDFTQASLGARVTSRKPAGMYFAGLHADYLDQEAGTVLTSEFLSENGWSGRIEVGGSTQLEGGFGLSTSFDISGIGGSAQTLSGGLRVGLQF